MALVTNQYENIGVITPEYNCCVQKVIEEVQPYLNKYGITYIIGNETEIRAVVEYSPEWILYFRAGVKQGTPPPTLMSIDGHTFYFRNLEIPVIYYLDDALFMSNNFAPYKVMLNCDAVVVATDALRDWLVEEKKYTKPVHTIKTHMALSVFDGMSPSPYLADRAEFNILFTSQGRIGATLLAQIVEIMNEHKEKYEDVRLIVVSHEVASMRSIINKYRNIKKRYYEFMPLLEFYQLVNLSSLMISPGQKEDLAYMIPEEWHQIWLDAKSCLKYNLSGASRIPIISSPLREYKLAIKHGETGYIAETAEEFVQYIDLMHDDRELNAKIGQAARDDIETNWDISVRIKEWVDMYRKYQI